MLPNYRTLNLLLNLSELFFSLVKHRRQHFRVVMKAPTTEPFTWWRRCNGERERKEMCQNA
jgi:hypothetical protein